VAQHLRSERDATSGISRDHRTNQLSHDNLARRVWCKPALKPGLWSRSRKDFQPEEWESRKMLTTPTPGRPFAHQLFVPQTCVSITLGNLSSLTLQQEMIMAIQKGYRALTCIPSLRGHSRSAASLGLITQPTLCEWNRSGLASLKFPFAHSGWHYRCSMTLATQQ